MEPKFEPPTLLTEKVAIFLTGMIIEGRLKPGEHLTEIQLSKRFEISRSPIREALRILEQKGFVVNIPRKGNYVRTVTKNDILEVFSVRAVLEGFAARLSTSNLNQEDFDKLEFLVERMTESANKNDFKAFLDHHYNFHRTYIKASKNGFLTKTLEDILNQALWLHHAYVYMQHTHKYSLEKHIEILRAFKEREAKEAGRLVEEHILASIDPMVKQLSKGAKSQNDLTEGAI